MHHENEKIQNQIFGIKLMIYEQKKGVIGHEENKKDKTKTDYDTKGSDSKWRIGKLGMFMKAIAKSRVE